MARKRTLRYIFEYLLYRVLTVVVWPLPRRLALALGGRLGYFCWLAFSRRRRLAQDNMQRAMPELNADQVRTYIKQMFVHLGIVAIDLLMLRRIHAEPELKRYFDIDGMEYLQQAHARGKGVLLVTAHLGFWEAGTIFLPKLGFPTAFIAKQMKNPRMNQFLMQTREMSGGEIIDARRGARRIVKALREGKVVCVLPDQDNRDGAAVDFFGHPARTTTMVVQLALETGAYIVPGFTLRTADNRYYNWIQKPLDVEVVADEEGVLRVTHTINRVIEDAIRRKPSQWFWLHNRWRLD